MKSCFRIFEPALVIAFIFAALPGKAATPVQKPTATPTAKPTPPPALKISKNTPPGQLPFWKSKPDVQRKMREDREVVVAVKREDPRPNWMRFTMAAAGHVARDKDFCFKTAQDYPKLKEISDHFKTVTYDAEAQKLFLITSALGYQARMVLKIVPVSEDWRSELQWEVVWGHFKGMTGVIGFERLGPGQTEMSIDAKYEAAELPLPKILMGFALEMITKKVAEKMRVFIEAQPGAVEAGNN